MAKKRAGSTVSAISLCDLQIPQNLLRPLVAFSLAFLSFIAASGGLFFYATTLQLAILSGVMVGLVAFGLSDAALAAASAVLLGWLVNPPIAGGVQAVRLGLGMALCAGAAAASAAGARWAAGRYGRVTVRYATAALTALLIVNLWTSAFGMEHALGSSSVNTWLTTPSASAAGASGVSDADAYLLMTKHVADGAGYYSAVRKVDPVWQRWPHHVYEVRPPLLYLTLASVAKRPVGIWMGFLVLSSLAVAAAALLGSVFVRPQLALVGATILAMILYFLGLCSEGVMFTETWGVMLSVIALSLMAYSATRREWKPIFLAGVIFALAAAATREFFLVVPMAGLLATFRAPQERRRLQQVTWSLTVASLVGYYALHWSAASALVVKTGVAPTYWRPSLGNLLLGVRYFAVPYGVRAGVASLFFVLGALSIFVVRRGETGLLIALVVATFAVFFTLNNNLAVDGGQLYNYWGIAYFPLFAALSPIAFSFIPGMRRPQREVSERPPVSS